MIDNNALLRATLVGTVLQVAMVVAGHFIPWVAIHLFMFGGMGISALAGGLYAHDAGNGYGRGALGGAIAGGVCALLGIAVSVILGDTATNILVLGTLSSAVTGAVGGLIGQMSSGRSAAAQN
ncbi:MAG: hypothetical protein ABSC92_17465 [Rhizomicrobium sp.]|jgi:hypothetical protein